MGVKWFVRAVIRGQNEGRISLHCRDISWKIESSKGQCQSILFEAQQVNGQRSKIYDKFDGTAGRRLAPGMTMMHIISSFKHGSSS